MRDLAGGGFDPSLLAHQVVDFYERTSAWRLEVWSQWSAVAWPAGWLLSSVFSTRLQQLGLPLLPLDAAHGIDSRIVAVEDHDGGRLGAAWLRTLRSTGVVFPLPNGSITVFLRPAVRQDGALVLESPVGGLRALSGRRFPPRPR